jgi:hypothetical protein
MRMNFLRVAVVFALVSLALLAAAIFAPWSSERHAAPPLESSAAPAAAFPPTIPAASGTTSSNEPVLEVLRRLQMQVEALAARVEALERAPRRRTDASELVHDSAANSVTPSASTVDGLSAQECLRRYVASFEDGVEGDEFYRMAVQAHVEQILAPVAAIVASPAYVDALRASLAAMLRKPKFGANSRVIDALLGALVERIESGLPPVALDSLVAIGGRAVFERLERLVWTLADEHLRHAALERLAQAAPGGLDAGVERLFAMARDDLDRVFLLSLLKGSDLDAALSTVRAATRFDVPVRLAAAARVGEFHGDGVVELVDEWLGFESNADVRAALGASRSSASETPRWHALQACGPPDADAGRDDARAWAPRGPQCGVQWLELVYDPPLRASGVRIHEVCTAGGVRELIARDEAGGEHVLWSGIDPLSKPDVLALDFEATPYRVQRLRLVIDTERSAGWEEIDAVQIVGPDGAAWAASAQASSCYGS